MSFLLEEGVGHGIEVEFSDLVGRIIYITLEDLLEDFVDVLSISRHSYPMIIMCCLCLELGISISNSPLEINFLIAFLTIVGAFRDSLCVCVNEES